MHGQGFFPASRGPFRVRFQRRSPGDTTLSESRHSRWLFKVGTSSHNWFTIGFNTAFAHFTGLAALKSKIDDYREKYANNQNISFLPAITSTSTRMHGEFLRLLFLQAHQTPRQLRTSQPSPVTVFARFPHRLPPLSQFAHAARTLVPGGPTRPHRPWLVASHSTQFSIIVICE